MHHKVLVDYELVVAQQGFIVRALLELEGKAPAPDNRIPLNLSVVLDRSGSMAGEKLEAARDAAAMLVRRLHPDDVVSVVAYDDEVITVAEPATGETQVALPQQLRRIDAGGSTNLSGGWLRGRELVARGQRERSAGGVNRVVLLTDGLANAGITDPASLLGLCRTACGAGITTTTIGFGADYDEKLLRGMADAGGANTYYIERPDQAADVFAEELEGLLTLCAQTVSVEIRPSDAVTLTAVRHQYPTTSLGDGGTRLEIGDIYAREPKSVLVEFFVPSLIGNAADGADASDVAVASILVTAHVLTDAGGVELQEITFPIVTRLTTAGRAEPEVRRQMLLLDAAKAREDALRLRDEGDFGGAAVALQEMSARLASAPAEYGDAYGAEGARELREQALDLADLAERFVGAEVTEADAKYLAQRAYNAHRGKRAYEAKLSRGPRGRRPT